MRRDDRGFSASPRASRATSHGLRPTAHRPTRERGPLSLLCWLGLLLVRIALTPPFLVVLPLPPGPHAKFAWVVTDREKRDDWPSHPLPRFSFPPASYIEAGREARHRQAAAPVRARALALLSPLPPWPRPFPFPYLSSHPIPPHPPMLASPGRRWILSFLPNPFILFCLLSAMTNKPWHWLVLSMLDDAT